MAKNESTGLSDCHIHAQCVYENRRPHALHAARLPTSVELII